jgi:hypothetical protein
MIKTVSRKLMSELPKEEAAIIINSDTIAPIMMRVLLLT